LPDVHQSIAFFSAFKKAILVQKNSYLCCTLACEIPADATCLHACDALVLTCEDAAYYQIVQSVMLSGGANGLSSATDGPY